MINSLYAWARCVIRYGGHKYGPHYPREHYKDYSMLWRGARDCTNCGWAKRSRGYKGANTWADLGYPNLLKDGIRAQVR